MRIVQAFDQLLVFEGGEDAVNVFQIGNLTKTITVPNFTILPALERGAQSFAVAVMQESKVILSGGLQDAGKKVSIYDLVLKVWKDAPPLNSGRSGHASCALGSRVYAFRGRSKLPQIEYLDVDTMAAWEIITLPNWLTMRYAETATVLSQNTIAVFGGFNLSELKDGFVLNTETQEVKQLHGEESNFQFVCYTAVQ